MAKYPIYLDLTDRRVVVIGAGPVAARKVKTLVDAGARIVVIAKELDQKFRQTTRDLDIEIVIDKYSKNYLAEATLAIAATNDPDLNTRIYKDCQELEILCNVVDVPRLCDFFVPAVVQRGDLQIAIGTNGACPAYARHLRKTLQQTFTESHAEFLNALQAVRKQVIDAKPDPEDRAAILEKLVDDPSFDYFTKNGLEKWQTMAEDVIKNRPLAP